MNEKSQSPITRMQCKMARAGLEWNAKFLAQKASVSFRTITRFEAGEGVLTAGNLKLIKQTFEAAGVEFIDDNCVRINPPENGEA